MKVHFEGTRRPARVAKLLRAELAAAGIPVGLARAQDIAARAFGYSTYKELQAVAGTRAASQWDEESPAATVRARRERQAAALVAAGMTPEAAAAAVARIRPSGRTLGAAWAPGPDVAAVQGDAPEPPSVEGGGERAVAPGGDGGSGAFQSFSELMRVSEAYPSFLELLRVVVHRDVTDIELSVRGDRSVLRWRLAGRWETVADSTPTQGSRLCDEVFELRWRSDGAVVRRDPRKFVSDSVPANRIRDRLGALGMDDETGFLDGIRALRMQFLPTAGGNDLRVAVLAAERPDAGDADPGERPTVQGLGYEPGQVTALMRMGRRPSGIAFIVGPAGSGRSTSLRALMEGDGRPRPARRIAMVIDDPGHAIPGAVLCEVNPTLSPLAIETEFAAGINLVMQSDPEVLVVGDLPRGEAVDRAWRAALAGKQVWVTLRGDDAFKAIEQLLDLGVERRRLTDGAVLSGIVAQKLVPRLCMVCSMDAAEALLNFATDESRLEEIYRVIGPAPHRGCNLRFARPGGCSHCDDGRLGHALVAEIVRPDQRMVEAILDGRAAQARAEWLNGPGSGTMLETACRLIAKGEVDPDDVERTVGLLDDLPDARIAAIFGEAAAAA